MPATNLDGSGGGVVAGGGSQGTGYSYNYSTSTGTPTNTAEIRFNNADITAATKAYVDDTTSDGKSLAALLQETIKDGYSLRFRESGDAGKYFQFTCTGITDQSGYTEFDIVFHDSDGSQTAFSSNTPIGMVIIPTGADRNQDGEIDSLAFDSSVTTALIGGLKQTDAGGAINALGANSITIVTSIAAATNISSGDKAVGIGHDITADGDASLALVEGNAAGAAAQAVGGSFGADGGPVANGTASLAYGVGAESAGGNSIAMGRRAGDAGTGADSLSFGIDSDATGSSACAFGNGAQATANDAVAFGPGCNVSDVANIAMGHDVVTTAAFCLGIGDDMTLNAAYQCIIGRNITLSGTHLGVTAVGSSSGTGNLNSRQGCAFGADVQLSQNSAHCFGTSGIVDGQNSVGLGQSVNIDDADRCFSVTASPYCPADDGSTTNTGGGWFGVYGTPNGPSTHDIDAGTTASYQSDCDSNVLYYNYFCIVAITTVLNGTVDIDIGTSGDTTQFGSLTNAFGGATAAGTAVRVDLPAASDASGVPNIRVAIGAGGSATSGNIRVLFYGTQVRIN